MSHSIIRSSGAYGEDWPANINFTQGLGGSVSMGGWTVGNEGFIQQTFLGASIRSFDISAGFGDSTSTLSVSLINDEYNKSDRTLAGLGDDVYHSGIHDHFIPPVVGSPVFFKFGKNFASLEQAWRKTYDDTYGFTTIPSVTVFPEFTTTGPITTHQNGSYLKESVKVTVGTVTTQTNTWIDKSSLLDPNNMARGKDHFIFGGILQSYTQNRGPDGNPLYNVSVMDPREILSNVVLILSDYAGTTYNLKNIINVYGFLEYDPSDSLQATLDSTALDKSILKKFVDPNTSEVFYHGVSTVTNTLSNNPVDCYLMPPPTISFNPIVFPQIFPITGQGFSRRSEKGMPLYRLDQAMAALFEFNGALPQEYKDSGFGGIIDFRGYKYVVDFSGIPFNKIPPMYFLDFAQTDLLSLAQELCDIISHDLFVSLLPIIDHPACKWLYDKNNYNIGIGNYSDIITGIIRIDTIDKSKQPEYGAIKSYLDNLQSRGIEVQNQDVGFEVSNVVTDRFITGAQEVDMYFFNNSKDRDNLELRKFKNGIPNSFQFLQGAQWNLTTSLSQQILPFYGFLGKDIPTIPRGFGSYQQIMLDSSMLDAYGVGNYYIATELELRAASVSYEAWSNFLCLYDERYMSRVDDRGPLQSTLLHNIPASDFLVQDPALRALLAVGEYAVDVPRCVFNSEKQHMGADGYPASPCSPPYGYPLYYKRAEKIGIPQAGVLDILNIQKRMISNLVRTKEINKNLKVKVNKYSEEIAVLEKGSQGLGGEPLTKIQEAIYNLRKKNKEITDKLKNLPDYALLRSDLMNRKSQFKHVDKLARESKKNSMKVYSFLKETADKYLGKAFLVKIPKVCNLNYNPNININNLTYEVMSGPFGFKPIPVNIDPLYTPNLSTLIFLSNNMPSPFSSFEHYLRYNAPGSNYSYGYGALKNNFNPVSESWEFNYTPEPQGGFFNFSLFDRNISFVESLAMPNADLPLATKQFLTPKDLTNFIEENGRIHAYVRYNNSENLNFKNVSKDSLAQEFITAGAYVPDIMEEIDNIDPSTSRSFDAISERLQGEHKQRSIAFVKCELDNKFYMAPKVKNVSTEVFGRSVISIPFEPNVNYIEVTGVDGCKELVKTYELPSIPMRPKGGGTDGTFVANEDFLRRFNPITSSYLVDNQIENLDHNNVYCLITIPGKVEPSVDARYLDGPYQAMNAPQLKNILTADVVKGVAGFEKPTPFGNPAQILNDTTCQKFTAEFLNNAMASANKAIKGASLASPEVNLNFTQPSPVYPDFIALPLMSNERCYGPWLSATVPNNELGARVGDIPRIRYFDIGGKVEFQKDETLAPWNYAGFQLMNEAGALKAQFSNSLMLFVERGGYVIPEAPTGISLAKALQNGGPLITSISVAVSDSITTTVKMDLYTARFGKLQKHKETALSEVVRARQKSTSQRNSMIRKGLIKAGSSSVNFTSEYGKFSNLISSTSSYSKGLDELTALETKKTTHNMFVATVKTETNTNKKIDGTDVEHQSKSVSFNTMPEKTLDETTSNYTDSLSLNIDHFNSAGGDDVFSPYSNDPDHPNMASVPYSNLGIYDILSTL